MEERFQKFHTYTQIAAGFGHTVLLQSDGRALAIGSNDDSYDNGQLVIPRLDEGLTYVQVSEGYSHTVMGLLLPSNAMKMDDARFRCQSRAFATWAIRPVADIKPCN